MVLLIAIGSLLAQASAEIRMPSMDEIDNRKENERRCRYFSENAAEYQQKNIKFQCGLTGALWKVDKQQQNKWCLSVPEYVANEKTGRRIQLIQACLKRKTATTNLQNKPQVPNVCYHSDPHFKAVKSLYREYRYQKTLEQPIENGLISYDYNKDKKMDYVFLELHGSFVEVVVCMSQRDSYQRIPNDISFYAKGDSTNGDQYVIRQEGSALSVSISSLMHNVGTSFRHVKYRYSSAKKGLEVVENHGDSSPVYYDGVPSPMSTPRTPTFSQPMLLE